MLTTEDICELLGTNAATLSRKVADRAFPSPIRVGGSDRWREDDFALYMAYLIACSNYRDETGKDPWGSDSPIAPPVYSTGIQALDLRRERAWLEEKERERRSVTLRKARAAAEKNLPGDSEAPVGVDADVYPELRVHDEQTS